jgi:putative ABC transport system permease protein
MRSLLASLVSAFARVLARRGLFADKFATFAAIASVALGTATVSVVVALDVNTVEIERASSVTNPESTGQVATISIEGLHADGRPTRPRDAHTETHEDYEVMRSAIRLGSLAAFLVGALVVFFTFAVTIDRKRREAALLVSLGATRAQVAAIYVRQAAIIGLVGGVLGAFAAVPLALLAARFGMTTTGRATIELRHFLFPKKQMALVALIGAFTSLLGVVRPARDLLRLDVAKALRDSSSEATDAASSSRRSSGVMLLALPFLALLYALMRPFFRRALPSLTFFVLEAGVVVVAFLASLLFVPELVRRAGSVALSLAPKSSAAALLTRRRVERMGDELATSVGGVMLVFALLLALHVATRALVKEVATWGEEAAKPYAFAIGGEGDAAARLSSDLDPRVTRVAMSGRTPWPNAAYAVAHEDLARLARTLRRHDLEAVAARFGPGRVILSRLMARRLNVHEGDRVAIAGRGGSAELTVVAVTDAIGWAPMNGPYRNGKTYALLDAANFDLLAPYAEPIGNVVVLATSDGSRTDWPSLGEGHVQVRDGAYFISGKAYEAYREVGTARDFRIFDVLLALTTLLAAIGVDNQLLLAVHARRRELDLLRSLGMTRWGVVRVVMLEGAIVGVVGGALAAMLGVPLGLAALGALEAVSAFDVRFELPWTYPAITFAGAVLVAVASSLHPAFVARVRRTP